ncbi:MAG: hypothetical protein WC740_15930 [Verrucomicrobiia bacterium]
MKKNKRATKLQSNEVATPELPCQEVFNHAPRIKQSFPVGWLKSQSASDLASLAETIWQSFSAVVQSPGVNKRFIFGGEWGSTDSIEGRWALLEQCVRELRRSPAPSDATKSNHALETEVKSRIESDLTRLFFGSSEFLECEFDGRFTPPHFINAAISCRVLTEGISDRGIEVPQAATEIERLNKLLSGSSLHDKFKEVPLNEEMKGLVEREPDLCKDERIRLNRLILEGAFPTTCPRISMRGIRFKLEDPELPKLIQLEIIQRLFVLSILPLWNPNAILAIHGVAKSFTTALEDQTELRTEFNEDDLIDEVALLTHLQKGTDPVSKFLMEQFTPNVRKQILEHKRRSVPSDPLRKVLLGELNRVVQGSRLIYTKERFPKLARRTRVMIERHHPGDDPSQLNRLLLQEAYPHEIKESDAEENIERLKAVARITPTWPVMASMYKADNDRNRKLFEALELNSQSHPYHDAKHVRPSVAKDRASAEVYEIRLWRADAFFAYDLPKPSMFESDVWRMAVSLHPLSSDSYKEWFKVIKARLMERYAGRPDLDLELRGLGDHKTQSSRAKDDPRYVDTYIRDGIWFELENAVKTVAKHDPDPPTSEEPRSAMLRKASVFRIEEFHSYSTSNPGGLIDLLSARGIEVPQGTTDIERLNNLLSGNSLYDKFKEIPLNDEMNWLIGREPNLCEGERIRLNRLILEEAFSSGAFPGSTGVYPQMPPIHNLSQWQKKKQAAR